jgi:hypothetical protein
MANVRIFVRLRKALLENWWVPGLRAGTFFKTNRPVRPGREAGALPFLIKGRVFKRSEIVSTAEIPHSSGTKAPVANLRRSAASLRGHWVFLWRSGSTILTAQIETLECMKNPEGEGLCCRERGNRSCEELEIYCCLNTEQLPDGIKFPILQCLGMGRIYAREA